MCCGDQVTRTTAGVLYWAKRRHPPGLQARGRIGVRPQIWLVSHCKQTEVVAYRTQRRALRTSLPVEASIRRTPLPVPSKHLRVWVGAISNAELFQRSGEEMAGSIRSLCQLSPSARVLEVGCGCGRLARAFGGYLSSEGSYEGFDVAHALIEWCKQHLQPLLPNIGTA
jgi:hypothetical protein